jgi:hypothetical protein
MTPLSQLAKEISSKNAGAFSLTLDVVFDDPETYQRVKQARVITAESVARAYRMSVDNVLGVIEFDQGNAFKVAIRRLHPSGSIGETDVFGAQQYAPLLDFEVP